MFAVSRVASEAKGKGQGQIAQVHLNEQEHVEGRAVDGTQDGLSNVFFGRSGAREIAFQHQGRYRGDAAVGKTSPHGHFQVERLLLLA